MKELQFMMTFGLSVGLVTEIDEFAKTVEGRALSRSEAIRQLVRIGLNRVAGDDAKQQEAASEAA